MSDAPPPEDATAKAAASDASDGVATVDPIENPTLAFVKGGTGTSASEKLYAQRFHEAEQRRDVADAERAASRDAQDVAVPGQDAPVKMPGRSDGAVMYTSQMTQHPEVPKGYILLKYLTPSGEQAYVNGDPVECCADLIVGANPARPTELCLILVCPRCEQNSHKHNQDNQLRIFQSNRYFEFVQGKGEPTFLFKEWNHEKQQYVTNLYRSAGMIVESEPFSCGDCGWRARIVENRVRPD